MSRLPVIVGFGGINTAGRSSAHHAYRRLVIDRLDQSCADSTYRSLAALMNLHSVDRQFILKHTLLRRIENNLFDPTAIRINTSAQLSPAEAQKISFVVKDRELPEVIPSNWNIKQIDDARVLVTCHDNLEILFPDQRDSKVKSGGLLPTGFDPETLYQSRNHPRGLQLTVYGASDAVNSLGLDWNDIRQKVPADQISVYASSAMGQLDANGAGGMLQAALLGKRVSARNCPLSLAEMIADFINAYILGSVGTTGANIGACATFLYNLRQGLQDIRSGKFRAVMVGASEAPITPEIIEGYRTMGALAEDKALNKIDGIDPDGPTDNTRACRPFAENCGFTLSEASQFLILFDDELAMEMGANIYGSVADVFINADGFKKSIPGPGIGNYVTMGKAMGLVRSILGEDAVRHRSYVQAHGTGTPQNRVTESHIFNELAKTFGIKGWPIAAIKAYVGHSLATASGDQITASLGVWAYGIIPGIKSIDAIADDVHDSHLDILLDHREIDVEKMDAVFINSKGFGGNNATAIVLSPYVTRQMLKRKHGEKSLSKRDRANEPVQRNTESYDNDMLNGKNSLIYKFGEGVITGEELTLTPNAISIPGHKNDINLDLENPYEDMS